MQNLHKQAMKAWNSFLNLVGSEKFRAKTGWSVMCSPRFLLKGWMNSSVWCNTSTSVLFLIKRKRKSRPNGVLRSFEQFNKGCSDLLHLSLLGKSVSLSSAKRNRAEGGVTFPKIDHEGSMYRENNRGPKMNPWGSLSKQQGHGRVKFASVPWRLCP